MRLAAALAVPPAGEAQQAAGVPRIGLSSPASPSDPRISRFVQVFRQALGELGYLEGKNIAIEFRWAERQYDRLPGLATELVRLQVNVIVAGSSAGAQAARDATKTVPIVMMAVADPVAQGFAASVARPGGSLTGLSLMSPELVGKQLALPRKVVPNVSRVALLSNPDSPGTALQVQHAQDAVRALGARLQPLRVRDTREVDSAVAAITMERADAVIVMTGTVLLNHRARIVDHVICRRLPTVFGVSEFVEAGGLLAHGPSLADTYRRSAIYVDRTLKGAKAADLPIEQPTTFELVIDLKSAKALGVSIPQAVLQRAERVIQ
jgi:putative ABC transport system substrate-binding protein